MPGWVVPLVPVDKLEAGRKRGKIGKPRAWAGEGIILIAPTIQGDQVIAAIARWSSIYYNTDIVFCDDYNIFYIHKFSEWVLPSLFGQPCLTILHRRDRPWLKPFWFSASAY